VLNDVPDDPADRERCFRIYEGQDDIVRVVWERDVRVTGEMAKQAIAAVDDLNGDRPRPLLVYMARTNALDRAARDHFAQKSSASAIALVGETPVDRLLAAFALNHGDTPTPARYFADERDAIAWLLTAAPPPP
jgi:hypothetical protein